MDFEKAIQRYAYHKDGSLHIHARDFDRLWRELDPDNWGSLMGRIDLVRAVREGYVAVDHGPRPGMRDPDPSEPDPLDGSFTLEIES